MNLDATILCGAPAMSGDRRVCANCVGTGMAFCSHLDEGGRGRLREMSRPVSFGKGETLFMQGETLDRVCIVSSGVIKLFHTLPDGQNQITGFLGPGDILGGIKRKENAHSTAKTLTPVDACVFHRQRFLQLIADYPELCLNLLVAATDEIEALNDHIILLGRKRAPERLAAFLLILSHRWRKSDADHVVNLPMSRADIADHLGLTVETVSRTFALFRSSGYITTPRPTVVVIENLAALYNLSGFDEIPGNRIALGL